jgi:hypothetical protein
MTVYVPAGTSNLNVPSGFALTAATKFSARSNKRTVTTRDAITCPVSTAPEVCVPVGETIGVGESTGVEVIVGVMNPLDVDVDSTVGVAVGEDDNHLYVETICSKTADSTPKSNEAAGWRNCPDSANAG